MPISIRDQTIKEIIEYKNGNHSAENLVNLKEDYEALLLATDILKQKENEKIMK